jgi:hypothetical protein
MNERLRHPVKEIIKSPDVREKIRHVIFDTNRALPQNSIWEEVELLEIKIASQRGEVI